MLSVVAPEPLWRAQVRAALNASYTLPAELAGHDASVQFDNILTAATANHRTVYIPPGEFTVSPETIGAAGSYNSARIVGEVFEGHYTDPNSYGSILKLKDGSNASLFEVAASSAGDVGPAPFQLENLLIKGNSANQTGTSYAVNFLNHTASANKQRSGFFRRVFFSDFRTSHIRVGLLRNAGIMEQVVCLDTVTGSCLQLASCSDWRFLDCDFGNTASHVVQDSGAGAIFFTNCNFFTGGVHGYRADTASLDHYFVNCSFDRNQRDGVHVDTTADGHWHFANCKFTLNGIEMNDTYADLDFTDTPYLSLVGPSFIRGSGSAHPQYNIRLAGTGAASVIGGTIEPTAAVTGFTNGGAGVTRIDPGQARFGTYTAGAAADSTGFITILDAAGNTRKIMVQA